MVTVAIQPGDAPARLGRILPLDVYGLIQITGPKAGDFLEGQLTNQVAGLASDHSQLTAHCNPKGRLRFMGRLFKTAEAFYLRLPREMLARAVSDLKKYALFAPVGIQVLEDWGVFGLCGLDILATLQQSLGCSPSALNAVVLAAGFMIHRTPGHEPSFELWAPRARCVAWLEQHPEWPMMPESYWHTQAVLSGLPDIYPATYEQFLPHALDLPELSAVSFTKGCFIGQEIIARMHYLGTRKRGLYQALLPRGVYEKGTPLLDGDRQAYGSLVLGANGPDAYQGLFEVDHKILEKKSPLTLDDKTPSQWQASCKTWQ